MVLNRRTALAGHPTLCRDRDTIEKRWDNGRMRVLSGITRYRNVIVSEKKRSLFDSFLVNGGAMSVALESITFTVHLAGFTVQLTIDIDS